MFRFRPSVESLETRETPSSLSSGTPEPSESFYGTGVYKSVDSGKTWTLAPDTSSAAKSSPLPVLLVIADQY